MTFFHIVHKGGIWQSLTLIRAAIKKDVDVRLGVIFDTSGNQQRTRTRTSHSGSLDLSFRKS
jgi:hypothetical protein